MITTVIIMRMRIVVTVVKVAAMSATAKGKTQISKAVEEAKYRQTNTNAKQHMKNILSPGKVYPHKSFIICDNFLM